MLDTQTSELGLSSRAKNVLHHNGDPATVAEARKWVLENLASYGSIPNCGKVTMIEICEAVGFPPPKLTQFPSGPLCASYIFSLHQAGHVSTDDAVTLIGRHMKWS